MFKIIFDNLKHSFYNIKYLYYYIYLLLLHVHGENSITIGINSNLPASISNINIHLEKELNEPKFSSGPTPAKPGPTLFNVAATAVKFVSKLLFSIAIKSIDATKIKQYKIK